MSQNKLLELKGIRKEYKTGSSKVVALKNLNLSINQGEYVSIMGPSGSGKSTLLNIMGLLDEFDSGNYSLDGKSILGLMDKEQAAMRSSIIGFVFQSFNLLPYRTALENVEMPLYYQNIKAKMRYDRSMYILDKLGLSNRSNHLPDELSGGQKQRVAIARALVAEPKIILADEPTGAIDSTTSGEIMELMNSIHSEGKTIIIVTHDTNIAAYTNRIINLKDGEIISDSTKNQTQYIYENSILKVP